jgi:hypothetical protein
MLKDKKYYFLVDATKSCQLSFAARWVYSFLIFRTTVNKPVAEICICRNLGISNRAVKGDLAELREAGLLAEANNRYLAAEPSEERWQWFVQKGKADALPWFQKFAYNPVYVPNPRQKMPLTHSALLSLAWSLRQRNGWKFRASGLATMLFPDLKRESGKRQVNRAAKSLRDKGLLDDRWNVTIEETHYHLWRDADHLANPRSRSDVGYASLRESVTDTLTEVSYQCRHFENLYKMGKRMEDYEHFMKIAGYSQSQILDYWQDVLFEQAYCNRHCNLLEAFVAKGFMPVFNVVEERTSQNRIAGKYTGISLGFLRKMTEYELLTLKDMAGKTNSNGESLLRYYEPDEVRMRASRMAG